MAASTSAPEDELASHAGAAGGDALELVPGPDLDPRGSQLHGQALGHRRVDVAAEELAALDHGDGTAEASQDRRRLAADGAAAEDQQGLGQLVRDHEVVAGRARHLVDAGDRWHDGRRSRGEHHVPGSPAAIHRFDDPVADDARPAPDHRDASVLQGVGVRPVVEVVDDGVAVLPRLVPGPPGDGVVQEGLARHAGRERAFAADEAGFEPDDLEASVGQLVRQRLPGGTESDDGDVNELGAHVLGPHP